MQLFPGFRFKALKQKSGPLARDHLFRIRLVRAFLLPDLFGAAFLRRLPVFRSNLVGSTSFCAEDGEAIANETSAAAKKCFMKKLHDENAEIRIVKAQSIAKTRSSRYRVDSIRWSPV